MSRQEFKQLELSKEDIFKIIISTPKLIKYISLVENPDFTSIIKNIKTKFEKKQKRIRQMEEDKDRKHKTDVQEKLQQIRQNLQQIRQNLLQLDLEEQQLIEQLSKLELNENKEYSSKGNENTEEKEVEENKENSSSEDAPRTNVSQNQSNPFALHQIQTGKIPQDCLIQGAVGQITSCTEGSNQHSSFEFISQGVDQHPPNFGDLSSIKTNNSKYKLNQ